MASTDPFSDAAFTARLAKLLPLLGSEQPGEADAARRKILEHLRANRLSLLDVAQRLGTPRPGAPPRGGFFDGARELSLERQLAIARAAKEEAAREAAAAQARVHELQVQIQRGTFDTATALRMTERARRLAAIGWVVGVVGLAASAAAWGPRAADWLAAREAASEAAREAQWAADPPQGRVGAMPGGGMADPVGRLKPGERPGESAVQDLPVRMSPSAEANVRTFVNRGEKLAIVQEAMVGGRAWLLVRTASGNGWVLGSDVLH